MATLLLPKKATQYAAKCVYIHVYIDLQTSADMLQNVAHCVRHEPLESALMECN